MAKKRWTFPKGHPYATSAHFWSFSGTPTQLQFQILIASPVFLDYDISDSGLECENSCGQEGLIDGRYWCYTFDSWDFCDTKLPGKI